MSDGKWESLSVKAPANLLDPVKETLTTISHTVIAVNALQVAIFKAFILLTSTVLNSNELLLKTALTTIETILDKFTKDGRVHLLPVAPFPQNPFDESDAIAVSSGEDSWSLNDTMTDAERKAFSDTMAVIAKADRGNEGFARIVVESIYDEADSQRPQYDNDCAIFALVIVTGGSSFIQVNKALQSLKRIFGTALKNNSLIPDDAFKSVKELKATPIASPESTGIGVLLSWVNPPTMQTLPRYGNDFVRLEELAIIRSTDDQAMLATNWGDLFGATQPTALPESTPSTTSSIVSANKKTKVIYRFRFNGVRTNYIDDDAALLRDTDYYYSVAYRYSIAGGTAPGDTATNVAFVMQDYDGISNVAKVRIAAQLAPSRGVAPDWITHTSLLNLIPSLAFAVNAIKAYVTSYKSRLTGGFQALQAYVAFLEAEGLRYAEYVTQITAELAKLKDILNIPATGIYVTTIELPTGGINGFASELAKRLSDQADTSAPPFFKSGLVGGVVLLAGATNPASLQSTKDFINLLFNPPAVTAWEAAVASIDQALTAVETAATSSTVAAQVTFNDAMEPVAATSDEANVPFDP